MEVEFFPPLEGLNKTEEFLENLDNGLKKKIFRKLDHIQNFGEKALKEIGAKKIKGKQPFWYLRIEQKNIAVRMCFVIRKGTLWIVHGFIKKKQEMPQKEIEFTMAKLRELDVYLEGGRGK